MEPKDAGIPTEKKGTEKDTTENKKLKSNHEAEALYLEAMQRVLNVNNWNMIGDDDRYRLYGSDGSPKIGTAEERDYIRIMPEGHEEAEWVQVERIITKLHDHKRSISMTVRPVEARHNHKDGPPVYNSECTITFVVQLDGSELTASIFERNRDPEAREEHSLYDKIRGSILDIAQATGICQKSEWGRLAQGFIAST